MAQYQDNGNSASDSYTVKQLSGGDGYGNEELDSSWRNKTGAIRGDVAGDVQARELAENDVAREARRKIIAILEEDEPPRRAPQGSNTGRVRRKNPGLSMGDLMEGLDADDLAALGGGLNDAMQGAAVDLMQAGYMGDEEAEGLMETRSSQAAEPSWDWAAVKAQATLRSGKKVPVWMVENKSSGMAIQKKFRIQGPADRIASLLNVTGNANDPRIRQIQEDYDEYVSLTKQLRQAKKLYESGDQDAGKTGQRIATHLRGVKQRLGI